jgi:hypothetical protein
MNIAGPLPMPNRKIATGSHAGGRSVRFFRVTTTVITRRIQVDDTGSTSMDLLASRISIVAVSETHEIGFNLVRRRHLRPGCEGCNPDCR